MKRLSEMLKLHAEQWNLDKRIFFLEDVDKIDISISYKELHRSSMLLANTLVNSGFRNQPVIIVSSSTNEFCSAFFGCMYSGAIAVPTALPAKASGEAFTRLKTILADTKSCLIVVPKSSLAKMTDIIDRAALENVRCVTTEQLIEEATGEFCDEPELTSPAFIQYSSGTTSKPKGIVVTHGNFLSNISIIREVFQVVADSRCLFWLPLHHDMGLIGGLLTVLYSGGTSYYMKPTSFVQRPSRWLQAASKYQINIIGGPNFSYDMCISSYRLEDYEGIDLSTIETAFNGAEVIRPNTLSSFSEIFSKHGFDEGAFLPCYGMAECTLLVSGSHLRELSTTASANMGGKQVFSSGVVADDYIVEIVDPESKAILSSGEEGEVWLSGSSVSPGIWGKSDVENQAFRNSLSEYPGKRFLSTGDLGVNLDNQLFITGRCKETIIVCGRNYIAGEIEYSLRDLHESFVSHATAAGAYTENNSEQLVVFQELKRTYVNKVDFAALANIVATTISQALNIRPHKVVFLLQNRLPRTTSGKIKRSSLCHALQNDELNTLAIESTEQVTRALFDGKPTKHAPASIAAWLIAGLSKLDELNKQPISLSTPFAHLGLDSSQALGLTGEINQSLEIDLGPTVLIEFETVKDLSLEIYNQLSANAGYGE